MILAEVNAEGVITAIKGIERRLDSVAKQANFDVAYEVLRLSQQQVPHDEGTLQNSATVEDVLRSSDIILGYHTPYAARLHEHPEYRFQKGRKGKYLEDPINHNRKELGLEWGQGMKRRLF